jgi:hypothetical protein
MPLAGFEPATKRLQTYALDRAATGIGILLNIWWLMNVELERIRKKEVMA